MRYAERVNAGVLGKIIGVYLGRPVEGWSYPALRERFGELTYYASGQLGKPLVVADDDVSGTFAFARAIADHGPRYYAAVFRDGTRLNLIKQFDAGTTTLGSAEFPYRHDHPYRVELTGGAGFLIGAGTVYADDFEVTGVVR